RMANRVVRPEPLVVSTSNQGSAIKLPGATDLATPDRAGLGVGSASTGRAGWGWSRRTVAAWAPAPGPRVNSTVTDQTPIRSIPHLQSPPDDLSAGARGQPGC